MSSQVCLRHCHHHRHHHQQLQPHHHHHLLQLCRQLPFIFHIFPPYIATFLGGGMITDRYRIWVMAIEH